MDTTEISRSSTDNTAKKTWYPVHCPDNGGLTDNVIMEDNPITGRLVGHYQSMGNAHYHATLHNIHVSAHAVLREVDLMFQSEIHFGIVGHWDGGLEWYLGLELPAVGEGVRGNEPTIELALAAVANAARRAYPESDFALAFASDVTVEPDQRTVEELSVELGALVGNFTLDLDTVTNWNTPDYMPWTLTFTAHGEERHFGGYTTVEVLRWAINFANDITATV